jgi:DNA replication and repair protein RecF
VERAEPGPARLAVSRLTLTDFRCYASLRIEPGPAPVVLFGPNGAGKTNVLEAISLLSPGRGLRRAPFAEIERREAGAQGGAWAVAATLTTPGGETGVGTGRDPRGTRTDGEGARRLVRIDGRTAKGPAALAEVVQMVWLTPEMDRLFLDGTGSRRRFLDRVVYGFDSGHAARLSSYERAMRQRARLLGAGIQDRDWLAALEAQMAEDGVAVAAARVDVAGRIAARSAAGFGPFPGAELAVEGTLEEWLSGIPALEAEGRFREALASSRETDARTGGAAVGSHRSDLRVRHRAKDMPAHQCSTGEQKALLIGIVLAAAALQADETGMAPLLLFDEVAAHLDEERRQALFARVLGLGSQVWLTGTERGPFAGLGGKARFFRVADAVVTEA